MGLLDRFKPKPDPLLQWLQEQYAVGESSGPEEEWTYWTGTAHGRKLAFNTASRSKFHDRELELYLHGRVEGEDEYVIFYRPSDARDPAEIAALPSLFEPGWEAYLDGEEAQELRAVAGFVLDGDFLGSSPMLRRAPQLAGYLERFSPAVSAVHYERPYLKLAVDRAKTSPQELKRDIERAHLLLEFVE